MCSFQRCNFQAWFTMLCLVCSEWVAISILGFLLPMFIFLAWVAAAGWQHIPTATAEFLGMPGLLMIPVPHRMRGYRVPVSASRMFLSNTVPGFMCDKSLLTFHSPLKVFRLLGKRVASLVSQPFSQASLRAGYLIFNVVVWYESDFQDLGTSHILNWY